MAERTVVREEGPFRIEVNANGGSYFLTHLDRSKATFAVAVGGAYLEPLHEDDGWIVDINTPYDEETESDIAILGERMDEQPAIELLWANRHNAYLG